MNKKDLIPVILLVLLIPVWMLIDRTFIAPKFPAKTPAAIEQPAESAPTTGHMGETALTEATAENATEAVQSEIPAVAEPKAEEVVTVLENDNIKLELTSLGGGIKSATLLAYPEVNEKDSPPVKLDFSDAPALAYQGLKGIGAAESLTVQTSADGKSVSLSKAWSNGTAFQRTITIGDGYLLTISDRFVNAGSSPWELPAVRILTGNMKNPADIESMKGISILGVDSYTPAGGINFWGRSLNKLYGKAKPLSIDMVPPDMGGVEVDWVSAKNKFFTQILRTDEPIATMDILSTRETEGKGIIPKDVAAALALKPSVVEAGSSHDINYTFFIGPKKYSTLQAAGNHMEKVMEFETIGFFSWMNWLMEPARRFLLSTLNFFDNAIPGGYGIAIILLTLLVRILFWPLTHKSTESMKRMQQIQPEIKALQAKYGKSNPQQLQQETMKLYKEKKVNPMGGCLPMFVQIPVFIALFTVLRNAIELRYASFLWISDLSAPENLFAGQIPYIGSLNILPLLMSASMMLQQKLTPQVASTPEQQQQQKMMMFMMPIMMLFFFYKMPSGLVLYWTTSNLLMIVQTSLRNVKKKVKEA
ncbi:MAG: membrane protein insertase YidC [Kiritimatiellales bacterium]|nr:membrane protein insertase YidC [Kiritimatiellales bacterium]MCF7864593.1 membrane protein insertase YidC [Kiritimatiellales bacterium]